jgi:UDP-N-acetyl-2-amino-2-deoxyglucuronate dehydrogenase
MFALERANVRWFLSTDPADLASTPLRPAATSFRSITVDGHALEFSDGFADLHTRVYEEILVGQGLRIVDARPSIELVHGIRSATVEANADEMHPLAGKLWGAS